MKYSGGDLLLPVTIQKRMIQRLNIVLFIPKDGEICTLAVYKILSAIIFCFHNGDIQGVYQELL